MLISLHLTNIALVDKLELTFGRGLSVLTGETGAGKSVIVTALSLVFGGRAEREYIRHGADRATVEATFDVTRMTTQFKTLFSDELTDNQLTVRREISRDGASKVIINGVNSSVARLKEVTTPLAEILGQHANQMLMNEENHLLFLDQFASILPLRDETAQLFSLWQKTQIRLDKTRKRRDELKHDRELLLFQREEIDKANISQGEENDLLRQQKILDSSRSLMESAAKINRLLDSVENSIIEQFRAARGELDKMRTIDPALKETADTAAAITIELEDLRRYMEQYASSIPDDSRRLEEINARLHELYQLKQKYGGSESAILEHLASICHQLDESPDTDALIESLEAEEAGRCSGYTEKALSLSSVRKKAASYLQTVTEKELSELAINAGGFACELIYEDDADGIVLDGRTVRPGPNGLEQAAFRFSANPGEPLKSLVKTASGGEISRVLLALKSAERKNNQSPKPLMVFDEIDSGIGGQTAMEVGKKIKRLSEGSQLLVITHLHQIARLADAHFVARKLPDESGRTIIEVKQLEPLEIQMELDRMVALPVEA